MKTRKLLIRVGVVALCVALGAVMMVIGRGHTVYLDNKTFEYNGQEYKAFYKVVVENRSLEKPVRLEARDRGMAKCIGQGFHMDLTVTETKDSQPVSKSLDLTLPYGMDNPIINLPALLADLPEEAWLDEFIPTPTDEELTEDVELGDEFGIGEEGAGDILG